MMLRRGPSNLPFAAAAKSTTHWTTAPRDKPVVHCNSTNVRFGSAPVESDNQTGDLSRRLVFALAWIQPTANITSIGLALSANGSAPNLRWRNAAS